jgi:hypothetical protein
MLKVLAEAELRDCSETAARLQNQLINNKKQNGDDRVGYSYATVTCLQNQKL